MMLRKIACLLSALPLLWSCNTHHRDRVFIKDKDFHEFTRVYSPNHQKLLLNYGSDKGAFSYAVRGTAILNIRDTAKNIVKFTLPNTVTNYKWIGNDTVNAQFDIIPSIRDGKNAAVKDTVINGVYVRIAENDYIGNNARQTILFKETSPNGKYEMVVYRYVNDEGPNLLHLSVIPAKATLPKYGNYFIANAQADYIYYARWNKANKLIFFTDDVGKDLVYYGLIKDRPPVEYQIVSDDDRYNKIKVWQGR
jgi:hypothetical protein